MRQSPRVMSFFVPELIEAQRVSFLNLLKDGIPEELQRRNPLTIHYGPRIKFEDLDVEPSPVETDPSFGSSKNMEIQFQEKSSTHTLNEKDQKHFEQTENQPQRKSVIFSNNEIDAFRNQLTNDWKNQEFSNVEAPAFIRSPMNLANSQEYRRIQTDFRPLYGDHNVKYDGFFQVYFHPSYRLIPPRESVSSAILNSRTYSAQLYVPVEIRTSRQEILATKWLLLGNLPIMTNRGHFIINGSPRVILHQLVRSPGVYYQLNFDKYHRKIAYADLICFRGVWLRMEIDKKARMFVRMKRFPKMPILNFLQCFGCVHPSLLSQLTLNKLPKLRVALDRKKRPKIERLLYQKMYDLPFGTGTDVRPQWPYPMGNQAFPDKIEAYHYLAQFVKNTYLNTRRGKNPTGLLTRFVPPGATHYGFAKFPQPKHMSPQPRWRLIYASMKWDATNKEMWHAPYYGYQSRFAWLTLYFFIKKRFLNPKAYDLSQSGRIRLNAQLGLNKPVTQTTLTLDDLICMTNGLVAAYLGQVPPDNIDDLKNRRVRCSGELIQNQINVGLTRIDELLQSRNDDRFHTRQKLKTKLLDQLRIVVDPKPFNGALKEFFHSSPLSQFLDQTNALAELTHKRRLSSLGPGGITRETAGMKIRGIHPSHYGRICPIETPEGPNAGLVNSLTTYARINKLGFIEAPFKRVHNKGVLGDDAVWYLAANQDETKALAPPDVKLTPLGQFAMERVPVRLGEEFTSVSKSEVDFRGVSRIQMISVATSLIPFVEHDDANRALMGSNMQRQSVPLLKPERAIVGTGCEGRVITDSGHVLEAKAAGVVTYVSSQKIQVLSFQFKQSPILHTYPLEPYQRSNQNTCLVHKPLVFEGDWVQKGTCLVDCATSDYGELAVGKNVLVAYLPWEGYNFEDAILISERLIYDDLFTSVHIIKHSVEIRDTDFGQERITCDENEDCGLDEKSRTNLDQNGIIRLGTWVGEGDILVRKVTPIGKKRLSPIQKFLLAVVDQAEPTVKDTSLRVPKGLTGRVIGIKIRRTSHLFVSPPQGPQSVLIWLAEKKWIQVGDKMAGRHGNKGIVSRILPRQDMPYLPDGTPIDVVLNPLGVPSRMNVGQIYECLLGLAGQALNQHYKILPFDEISGAQASRSLVYTKLYEAREKTGKKWLFSPQNPGKTKIFDGRTGDCFDQPVTVGQAYMLKLIHLVDDKIHARATGPYSLVTQQPLRGRSKHGGQRFGEMEVWALEGFGAAYTLQEILTIKSDDIYGRHQVMRHFFKREKMDIRTPESFRVLMRELQALCLKVNISRKRI